MSRGQRLLIWYASVFSVSLFVNGIGDVMEWTDTKRLTVNVTLFFVVLFLGGRLGHDLYKD